MNRQRKLKSTTSLQRRQQNVRMRRTQIQRRRSQWWYQHSEYDETSSD